jgi:hypothetical protein
MSNQMKRQPPPAASKASSHESQSSVSDGLESFAALRSPRTFTQRFRQKVDDALHKSGYLPPEPPPLVKFRIVRAVADDERSNDGLKINAENLLFLEMENEKEARAALSYVQQLSRSLESSVWKKLVVKLLGLGGASVSVEMPRVSKTLQDKMVKVEQFLSMSWTDGERRGTIAVHVDEESSTTVVQIGLSKYGPVYVTIPRVLKPEDAARQALSSLFKVLEPFRSSVDPLAVINGDHQKINFTDVFRNCRVLRAPSGNVDRLRHNLAVAEKRERLSPENTSIINSSPRTEGEYRQMFANGTMTGWAAWSGEAAAWNQISTAAGFSTSPEASQATFVKALAETKNVIVITAHCDGKSIFMPEPPPDGTVVTAEYLLQHKAEIAANAPFVYLFSCHAGDLSNLQNFASTLLDCGASGVIAAQGPVVSATGQLLLGRLLGKTRGAPPLTDFQNASKQMQVYDMEVYLG